MEAMVRLADGVTAGRGRMVWAPVGDDSYLDAQAAVLDPGAAVLVGPAAADDAQVREALGALRELVAAGGVVAAGAGVELGPGFRSARLAGGRGDRRDAMLAALRLLGVEGAGRLGSRAGVMVALFGTEVTKPVGVAAAQAIRERRWAALHLASAASDILGPEQLVEVLHLAGPDGVATVGVATGGVATGGVATGGVAQDAVADLAAGPVSGLADNLGTVLGPMSRARRLKLIVDVWDAVRAHHAGAERGRRLVAVQGRRDRYAELRQRHQQFIDDQIVDTIRMQLRGREPTLAEAARWVPTAWDWQRWLSQAMHDALAATVLLRTAIAVADHGIAGGVARLRHQVAAAAFLLSPESAALASRRSQGQIGLPARPGCYLRQIDGRLERDPSCGGETMLFIGQRLSRAREYGLVALEAAQDLLHAIVRSGRTAAAWDCGHLRQWRGAAGFTELRPPNGWHQPPLGEDPAATLAQRLQDDRGADPAAIETPGDLLWYAELADAVAQLNGHPVAAVAYGPNGPSADVDPTPPPPEPLRPRYESVSLAVAGAAQLISIGAAVPTRPRSWAELVDGLLAATVVAEALTGQFPLPAAATELHGVRVPGTDLHVELARDPHQLADWSSYMGNCIASSPYLRSAGEGSCVLAALRDAHQRIVANVELLPARGGWQIGEFRARFNADPDPALEASVRSWVGGLRPHVPPPPRVPGRPHVRGPSRTARRGQRLLSAGPALAQLAAQALQAPQAAAALEVLNRGPALTGVTALRRASAARLDEVVRRAIAEDGPSLVELWRATAARPLAVAVGGLDPALRESIGHLDQLLADAPLTVAPRRLARLPAVAEARTVDLVALRLRAALGRLVRGDDPAIALAVAQQVETDVLCALVLAISTAPIAMASALTPITATGARTVPGFPRSALDDESGPWQHARTDAMELGADPAIVAAPARLLVPTAWLGRGGWAALWARAAR
jgi:hypothetical protein